jgi:hypothetical protein
MPLALMTPDMAQSLVSIGLPYGPNTKPINVSVPRPDAATQEMNLSAALGANPQFNGTQQAQQPPQMAQPVEQASQQNTQAIYSDSAMQQQQAAGQAARLAQAQAAQKPAFNAAAAGGAIDGQQASTAALPASPGESTPASLLEALQNRTPGYASQQARLQAAQQASAGAPQPPATPPQEQAPPPAASQAPSGPPQAPPAPTSPAPVQTPPVAPPGPAEAPVGTPQAPAGPTQQATQGRFSPAEIKSALIKQGMPERDAEILTAVSGAESGYGANPISPKNKNGTTDYGLFQINSVHNDLNPESLVNADLNTQAKAAYAVYQKEGLGAWTTYKNGAYQKYAGDLNGDGQFTGASTSSSSTSNGTYSPAHAQQEGTSIGIDPGEMMKLATALGYKPVDTDAVGNRNLIAMGLGMMGGRTYADSMKNAAGIMNDGNNALLGVQEKQNSNALSLAQVGINARRADAQLAMQGRRMDALDRDRPLGPATLQPDGTYGITMQTPATGATHVVPVGTPTSVVNSDPNRKADTDLAKDAAKEQVKLLGGAGEDQAALQNIASARNVVKQHPELLGPTLGAQARRYMATSLGMGDTATLQAFEKMSAQGRMNYLQEATGGHVGGIRSNAELENIGKAVVAPATDVKAADYLLGVQQRDIEARQALRATLAQNAHSPDWQGKNYLSSQSNFLTNYMTQHPVIWDNGQGTQPALDLSKFWTK